MAYLKLAAGFAALAVTASAAQAKEPPPLAAFGRLPAVESVDISPDGKRLALLGGPAGARTLAIATIDGPTSPPIRLGDVDAISADWVGNDHVLVRVARWEQVDGKAYRMERNIAFTAQGQLMSTLLSTDEASSFAVEHPQVALFHEPPRALVLGLAWSMGPSRGFDTYAARKGVDSPFVRALWSVDPATGKGRAVERGGYDTWGWDVDLSGEPRVRYDVDEISRAFSIHVRGKGQNRWTVLERGEDIDAAMGYIGYSDPDDGVYLREAVQGGERVVLKKLSDGSVTPLGEPTPGATPYLLTDPYRGAAVAVVGGAERPEVQWLDAELGQVHALLSRAFKDRHVSLHDWSRDRSRFIVRVDGPGAPPAWMLYDKAAKSVSPLGEEYPELEGVELGATRWITYKARDGLEIGAYLTLPPASLGVARAPLIVMPHGGPGSRDEYAFDFLTQFLASRGYAVLRPQFRGSTGFGRAFYEAGRAEWGGKMQTDLLDGVAAVRPLAEVDAERSCIVGWSFGGYAALAGVSLHPGAYRCAASVAGISDLKLLLAQQGGTYGRASASFHSLRRMLARNGPNSPELVTTSPLRQVANIQAPVLLVHGGQDTIVEPVQSAAMRDALKAAGKPVEHLLLPDDDHYLRRPTSRTQLLTALESFLAKNLPVQR
ncbi:alpha/beta hydrolase family protein [Phenylobacterium terrae]|uniref:Alpha/beta hydrolase family protein n=1 Tax=Phenylobacterium terrae TaxID=2665495 RepID=A0ABW4N5N2_9CAUL